MIKLSLFHSMKKKAQLQQLFQSEHNPQLLQELQTPKLEVVAS